MTLYRHVLRVRAGQKHPSPCVNHKAGAARAVMGSASREIDASHWWRQSALLNCPLPSPS